MTQTLALFPRNSKKSIVFPWILFNFDKISSLSSESRLKNCCFNELRGETKTLSTNDLLYKILTILCKQLTLFSVSPTDFLQYPIIWYPSFFHFIYFQMVSWQYFKHVPCYGNYKTRISDFFILNYHF